MLLQVGRLVTDDFKVAGLGVDREDLEFLAVLVGVRGVAGLLQRNVVADFQAGEVLAENARDLNVGFRVVLHPKDVVADEVGAHVVQLVRREVVVAAEVVVHVNLQAAGHGNVVQVVLAAGEGDAGFFNADAPRFKIALAAKLVDIARQLEEIVFHVIFLGAVKHEVVVKAEDVVADDDVGVFALDKGGPSLQQRALGFAADNVGARHGIARAQSEAVVQVRAGFAVSQEGGADERDFVAFHGRKHGQQRVVHVGDFGFAIQRAGLQHVGDGFVFHRRWNCNRGY